jgi:hypothetical protein
MNNKLFQVTCCGKMYLGVKERDSIYVIAEDEKEAAEVALNKMRELKYDKIDGYVSSVRLIADEKESNGVILIFGKVNHNE